MSKKKGQGKKDEWALKILILATALINLVNAIYTKF